MNNFIEGYLIALLVLEAASILITIVTYKLKTYPSLTFWDILISNQIVPVIGSLFPAAIAYYTG